MEKWQQALDSLEQVFAPPAEAVESVRLVWVVRLYGKPGSFKVSLNPREQKRGKSSWTGGRAVALKRLWAERNLLKHLTPADRRICECIEFHSTGYYGAGDYLINVERALGNLVRHPLVFLDAEPLLHLTVGTVRPVLRVESWQLKVDPPHLDKSMAVLEGAQLKLVQLTDTERAIFQIVGQGISFPPEGQGRARRVLEALGEHIRIEGLEGEREALQRELLAQLR